MITKYKKLPLKVKKIFEKHEKDFNEDEYNALSNICEELKAVGWFMDYYLTGEITELRPLRSKENE